MKFVTFIFFIFLLLAVPRGAFAQMPCTEFPPVDAPAGYFWKADCSASCQANPDCKEDFESNSSYVYAPTSYWCHGFADQGQQIQPKCMQLVYAGEDNVEEDQEAVTELQEAVEAATGREVTTEELQDKSILSNVLKLLFDATYTPIPQQSSGTGTSASGAVGSGGSSGATGGQGAGSGGGTQQTTIPPLNGTTAQKVHAAARQIIDRLEFGQMGTYCRHVNVISLNGSTSTPRQCLNNGVSGTGKYWCTNLVIDATNLAGFRGLNASHQSVTGMIKYWMPEQNTVFLDYHLKPTDRSSIFSRLTAGCVMFQETTRAVHTARQHVSIVDNVVYNASTGNGSVTTLDSNGSKKSYTFPITNNQLRNIFYPVVSFGCYK